MFDLNEVGNSPVIFNGGNAGLAKDVKVSEIQLKGVEDSDTHPDFKVIIKDSAGATLNAGFYYPKADANKSEEQNAQRERTDVGRIVHLAKAILGQDFVFPSVNNSKEAFDLIFKLIEQHKDKLINVYVTYGSLAYPKKYLNLRYFEFVEDAANTPTRLRDKVADLLERPVQDEVKTHPGNDTKTPIANWS